MLRAVRLHRVLIGLTIVGVGGIVPAPTTAGIVAASSTGVRLGPLETMCVDVPGATVGDLALVNVTVAAPTAAGFLTAHSELGDPAATSTVNFAPGQATPAFAVVDVTDAAQACFTLSIHAAAHVVVDLAGVLPSALVAHRYERPMRVLDTRSADSPTAGAPVAGGGTVCVPLPAGANGDVAVLNVTAAQPRANGYLTVHTPDTLAPGSTSTLNYAARTNRANLTIVEVGVDGAVCASVSDDDATHVIFDVVTVLSADAFVDVGSGRRAVDTRLGGGARPSVGTPVCTEPLGDPGQAVVANVTMADAGGPGHANTHAAGADPTRSSTNNYAPGSAWANVTMTTLGADGRLCVTPFVSASHVVVDVLGVMRIETSSSLRAVADRLVDTRQTDRLPGRIAAADLQFEQGECPDLLQRFIDRHVAIGAFPPPIGLPATNGNGATTVPDHSTTNVQVEGIDEGDFVETDGRYLYSTRGAELRITDLDQARVVATAPLDGAHAEMILHGSRLMVTTTGFDRQFRQTNVVVFDVSDPVHPVAVDRYGVDGTRVAMRGVGDTVHLVLRAARQPYEPVWNGDPVARAEAIARIESSTIADWLPHEYGIRSGEYVDARPAVACSDLGRPSHDDGIDLLWISSRDMTAAPGSTHGAGIVGNLGGANVMATADRLYVSTWGSGAFEWWGRGSSTTGIHLFDLAGDTARYVTSTDLPGHVLNQFSMAEVDGILRVAVTDGWWTSSESIVFALRPLPTTFERLSAVGGLGRGEDIYAVRHVGDMSYVVTFRRTDPLYVVDFTDPIRPRLRGELKVPGFSTYLHPLSGGRLLGIGNDADPETGQVTGTQISLFDVRDPDVPLRRATYDLPGTIELHDHRAVLFWPPDGTVALPGNIDGVGGAILVARVFGNHLVYAGAIYQPGCAPYRTVVVGDRLIAVSDDMVTIADRTTLAPIATIGACPGS